MTTGILALIIFAAIFVQITVAVLIGLYRRRRQYRNLDEQGVKHKPSSNPMRQHLLRTSRLPTFTYSDFYA